MGNWWTFSKEGLLLQFMLIIILTLFRMWLSMPVLSIYGTNDAVATLDKIEELRKNLPTSMVQMLLRFIS